MALSKFLLSIDWSSESEVSELPSLLELWKVGEHFCLFVSTSVLILHFGYIL